MLFKRREEKTVDPGEKAVEPPSSWSLIPLTPGYVESAHGLYLEALESALEDSQVRNIALAGGYGVGKSSILREFAKRQRKRTIELSVSTFGTSSTENQAGTHSESITNRIQREIVKQLLYRQNPSAAPASRFRRIQRFHPIKSLGFAALFGLVVAVTFILLGWTANIAEELLVPKEWKLAVHVGLWVAATALALATLRYAHGKIHVAQLSVGSGTVTLDRKSASYFDQYLDEIVYFFETSRRNVVIFEDIDRFDDANIFETLGELNRILNSVPKLPKKKMNWKRLRWQEIPIRFIYAAKDSIFEDSSTGVPAGSEEAAKRNPEGGVAETEVQRANRTKFFDVVVPVVPFISSDAAISHIAEALSGIKHAISPELIALAARYVPDMRLLKNIRNEFVVYRNIMLGNLQETQKGIDDKLFAMILYKNTHLADFEALRLGQSRLDDIYYYSRNFVRKQVELYRQEIQLLDSEETSVEAEIENRDLRRDYCVRQIQHLESADYSDLMAVIPFQIEGVGSVNPVADFVKDKIGGGLAYELIRAGYINRDYKQYVVVYHRHGLSDNAMNFIMHNLGLNVVDERLVLSEVDIKYIVGAFDLNNPAFCNISVLDYLLKNDRDAAKRIVEPLVLTGDWEGSFIQTYLRDGQEKHEFIRVFAEISYFILQRLVTAQLLSSEKRLEFVDVALGSIGEHGGSSIAVPEYLREHYEELSVFTSSETNAQQAKRIADLFVGADIYLPRLAPLGEEMQAAFVARKLYKDTAANRAIAESILGANGESV